MKPIFKTLLTSVFFLMLQAVIFSQTTITLLHFSDSHSHLDAVGPKDNNLNGTLGGIAKAVTLINTVKAAEQNVLILHGGDFSVGDLFYNKYFGVPELQILKQIGLDAIAVGNHEFDLGPDVLNATLEEGFSNGSFPVLSANLDMTGYPALTKWISPSVIKTIAGVKIGIFGLTIPDPLSNPSPVIVNEDIIPIAYQTVANLKNSGADVIICLSHLGIMYDRILASNVAGIDFIAGAHDHILFEQPIQIINPSGKTTYIMQAGSYYQHLGKLKFTVNNGIVTVNNYMILNADENVQKDAQVQAVVEQLKAGIVAQYGDVYHNVMGTAVNEISKMSEPNSRFKDTPLGNLITDAFRDKTNTNISITANGLISEKIYQGPIVGADIFRAAAYGFDEATGLGFKLATLSLKGSELLKGLEIGMSQLGINDDYFLQVSGMSFNYNPHRPVGHRVTIGSIRINGNPFILVNNYTLTVNSGLLGLLLMFGVQAENINVTNTTEYNAIKDYIEKLQTVNYVSEGRITDLTINNGILKPENNSSEFKFRLKDNYPNPFNPTTNIKYILSKNTIVRLTIYDILGREVAKLVDGMMEAGEHQATWNAGDLPSGVYFYKLSAGDYTETKKMLLIK